MPDRPTTPPNQPPDDDGGGWRTSLAVPVLIVALAAGLIGALIWVSRSEQDAGADALAGTTVEGPLPLTVPYRQIGGAIVVDVTLGEGSRTVPMILDTGAPTIVSEEIAAVYAGETLGTIAGAAADGQVITSDVVRLPQLAIGEAVFADVGTVVGAIEPGNPFYCITQTGFIGASLMQAAVWQVDPGAGTVTIAASTADLDLEGATRFDFSASSEVSPSPLFELPTGEGALTLLLDTGSDGWLAAHPADLDPLGVAVPDEVPTESILATGTGTGGDFTTRAHWLSAEVGLDGERKPLPIAAMETVPQGQGNAGTDFLRHFVLTVDWPGGALYLEPLSEAVPSTPASAGLGWDGGYVVGSFVEGLPGAGELELGASVSAIDGESVAGVPFDDYCTRVVRGEGPDTYEMTVAGEVPMTVDVASSAGFFEPLRD